MKSDEIRIASEFDPIFKNYALTDLMLVKKGGKKKVLGNNYAVYLMLNEFLSLYGLLPTGNYIKQGLEFRALKIDYKTFPLENELIIQQCYGFDNYSVELLLDSDESCGYYFEYNTTTFQCKLKKMAWGSVKAFIDFPSFEDMILELRTNGYRNLKTEIS